MRSDDETLDLATRIAADLDGDVDPEKAGALGSDVVRIITADAAAGASHLGTALTLLYHAIDHAPDHPCRGQWMANLGTVYALGADHTGDLLDWDRAISWLDRALHLMPAEDRADVAMRLAWTYYDRGEARAGSMDTDESELIDYAARTLIDAVTPLIAHLVAETDRATAAAMIGHAWSRRYEATDDPRALATAIDLLSSNVSGLPEDEFAADAYEALAELLDDTDLSTTDGSIDRAVEAAARSVELCTADDPGWSYRNWLEGMHRDRRLDEMDEPDPHERDRVIACLTIALADRVDAQTALALGTRLVERGAMTETVDDLRHGIRWLRESLAAEESPGEFTWVTWLALTEAYGELALVTEAAEDVAEALTCATTTLTHNLPQPTFGLKPIVVRAVALFHHSSGDAKVAATEFPVVEWLQRDTEMIIAAAGDSDAGPDDVAICAGYLVLTHRWLSSELGLLTSTTRLEAFVERLRVLARLALTATEPPDDSWHAVMSEAATVADLADQTAVRVSSLASFDLLIRLAQSSDDTELSRFAADYTPVVSAHHGIQTGSLASLRAGSQGLRRGAASREAESQEAADIEASSRVLEFVIAGLTRPNSDLNAELDRVLDSVQTFSGPQASTSTLSMLMMFRDMIAVDRTGELPQLMPVVQPGDPLEPLWRMRALVPRIYKAHKEGRAEEVRRLVTELEGIRDAIDLEHDLLAGPADMIMSMVATKQVSLDLSDRSHLDRAIAGHEQQIAQLKWLSSPFRDLLTDDLGRMLRQRGDVGDLARSRELGLEAVASVTWRVLVQSEAADAIAVARMAVLQLDEFVTWCVEDNSADELVRLLEAQRGLVLHAANTNRSVARQLEAMGEGELAAKWVAAAGDERAGIPGMMDALPTDLRARVLRTLGERGSLLSPPSVAEIQGALAAHGSDVLIYLVAATKDRPGMAVAVPREGPVELVSLRDLATESVDRYVRAYTAWQEAPRGDERVSARTEWYHALDELCDWAWDAAGADILRLGLRFAAGLRDPRIVLTPMGVLGLVPWHAARRPVGARPRYLLHDACVSYTPSARMLCEVTSRQPIEDGETVLIGDPAANLYFGGIEVRALRNSFYPGAKFLGGVGDPVSRWVPRVPAPDGAGTPEEVAAALLARPAMVHFACHAMARVDAPQESYLQLAGGRRLEAGALLDLNPTGGLPIGLAILAGCTTSLSGVDYDEALSLSSTFLAIGARSVLGSLWPIPSGRNTVHLTYLINHHLAQGLPIADALRHAQLWMLKPNREFPESIPDVLTRLGGEVQQEHVSQWAAFQLMGM